MSLELANPDTGSFFNIGQNQKVTITHDLCFGKGKLPFPLLEKFSNDLWATVRGIIPHRHPALRRLPARQVRDHHHGCTEVI